MSWQEAHIYYKRTDEEDWSYAGTTREEQFIIDGLIDGDDYTISVVTAYENGTRPDPDDGHLIEHRVVTQAPVPKRVTNFTAAPDGDTINFCWDADINAETFEIRVGSGWANALSIACGIPCASYSHQIRGIGPQEFLIKGRNRFGEQSPWAQSVTVTREVRDTDKTPSTPFGDQQVSFPGVRVNVNNDINDDVIQLDDSETVGSYTTQIYDTGYTGNKQIYFDVTPVLIQLDIDIDDLDFTGESQRAFVISLHGPVDQFHFEDTSLLDIDELDFIGESVDGDSLLIDGGLLQTRVYDPFQTIDSLFFTGDDLEASLFSMDGGKIRLDQIAEINVLVSTGNKDDFLGSFQPYKPGRYTERFFQFKVELKMAQRDIDLFDNDTFTIGVDKLDFAFKRLDFEDCCETTKNNRNHVEFGFENRTSIFFDHFMGVRPQITIYDSNREILDPTTYTAIHVGFSLVIFLAGSTSGRVVLDTAQYIDCGKHYEQPFTGTSVRVHHNFGVGFAGKLSFTFVSGETSVDGVVIQPTSVTMADNYIDATFSLSVVTGTAIVDGVNDSDSSNVNQDCKTKAVNISGDGVGLIADTEMGVFPQATLDEVGAWIPFGDAQVGFVRVKQDTAVVEFTDSKPQRRLGLWTTHINNFAQETKPCL